MRHSLYLLFILFVGLVALSSCTDAQIARLDAVVASTEKQVDNSAEAIAKADAALVAAKALAEQLGIERAKPVIEQAQQAVSVAHDAHAAATAAAKAARDAADAARQAQEAGGGTIGVIVAGVLAFLTGGAAALPAITKAVANGRALVQTVRGLDKARESLGEAEWKSKVAPALGIAQDDATKIAIRKAQL